MKKFISHTGIGVPLQRSNVDTDQIIPAVYLKRVTKSGFEDGLFAAWRQDKNFILNRAPYKYGSILVAGPDFGTGSSREHAVWALRDYGFKVVLAPKFADIFRGNCEKDGMVAGVISPEDCQTLWKMLEVEPGREVTVDLENKLVTCGSFICSFQIDDYTRWRLLEGLDDIDLTLRDEDAISAFEQARPDFMPRTLPAKHLPPAEVVSAREVPLGIPQIKR
ncbi:3-isopropylmalate dehydratase small subunit [Varibaculum vaginae]|uniref:3-isopropylmalate dehydratase small subunit n=1 Tax=Varibaculum vaginae TaxID=2364797 RepID=UPI000F078461|nr:3-isopropylmalate dehydratase small subunit [Varibaculum vaginae]